MPYTCTMSAALFALAISVVSADVEIAPLLQQLSETTGLPVRHAVTVREDDRKGLGEMLQRLIVRQYPGARLEHMNRAFAAIGLLPKGYDLRKEALALFSQQVSGYYDPYSQRLVLLKDTDDMHRLQVLLHELTHALQDQSYTLERLLDRAIVDEDRALALQGALEGQAMLAMTNPSGIDGAAALKELVADGVLTREEAKMLGELAHEADAAPAGSPDYLQAQLTFPYEEGARFINELTKKESFAAVIRRTLSHPPITTKQVMYPSAYLADEAPEQVSAPKPGAIFETTIGALNVRTLLGGASELPQKWKGDRIFLYPSGVVWITKWESSEAAAAFLDAYAGKAKSKREGRAVTFYE